MQLLLSCTRERDDSPEQSLFKNRNKPRAELGDDMMIGARAENKLNDWHKAAGSQVKISSFEQIAAQVEVILDATDLSA